MQTPVALPQLVNGRQYMELHNEAMSAAGFSRPFDEDAFAKYDSGRYPNEYSNTDWVDEIFKKGAFQTGHTLNMKGGSDKIGYFMSYGYLEQDGLVVGDAFNSRRHNARISLNTEVKERLKLNGTVSFVDYHRSASGFSGAAGVFRLAQRLSPLLPVKWKIQDEKGNWQDTPYWSYGSVGNPLCIAREGGTEKRQSRTLNLIAEARLKILEDLYLNGQYSANYYFRETNRFRPVLPKFSPDGEPSPDNAAMVNSVFQAHQDALTQNLLLTLNYGKRIRKHEFSTLLGYSQEWYDYSDLEGSRQNIIQDGVFVLAAGTEAIENNGVKRAWALQSCFGRLNYSFDGKYLVEANLRIDGTSRFARDNRWGCFPSFSAGWNFTKENYMRFVTPVLETGKLRISWGELGNQNVGSSFYPYLTPIEPIKGCFPIGGINGVSYVQKKLGNRNIRWETIRMFNVGTDLGFLDNRLQLSFDWFKKENINAIVKPVYPTIIGVSASADLPFENLGEMENKGWELDLSWKDRIGPVKYSISFNISDSKNKITDLGFSEPSLGDKIRRVGDPIGSYYGYLTDGLAQISDFEGKNADGRYIHPLFAVPSSHLAVVQPGDIKYRDISGPDGVPDGMIDENDKTVFGDPDPHYAYSFRGAMSWKGIDFSFYLQGVGKADGYLSEEARHCFINDYSVPKTEHLDRWTPNNPNASYPRLFLGQSHNLLFSDYWREDASYLRLKNLQLGYTFPKKWMARSGISGLRVFSSADNLLTFTNYFGAYDPEVRETSGDAYPQVKTCILGVSVTF